MFTDTRRIAKKPSKRTLFQIDRQVEAIFYRHCYGVQIRHCYGVQIPVLQIENIFRAGRDAALAGQDVEAAVLAAVAAIQIPEKNQ